MLAKKITTNSETGGWLDFSGSELWVSANGTWGSGTLTLQYRDSWGEAVALTNGALTADATKKVSFPPGASIRYTYAGTSPDLKLEIRQI